MRRTLLALALASAACVVPKPPGPVPRPPVSTPVQYNLSVYDEAAGQVQDADCVLQHDMAAGEAPVQEHATGWRESFSATSPPVHQGWGAILTCSSPSYLAQARRYDDSNTLRPGEQAAMVLKATHSWGDEDGRLTRSGLDIRTSAGARWRYRGFTAFKWLQASCDGQDIDPWIEQASAAGARVFRVLGMYEPYIGTFTLARDDTARFDGCLLDLAHRLADHGLRLQFTVFADAQNVMPSVSQQRAWFAHVAALVANEWNVLGELCNECDKNGVDPSGFPRPPVSQVLWSRGSGLGGADPAHDAWDVVDYHEARSDDYYRKNECRPYMTNAASPVRGFPCLQSEPMGFSETAQPGKRDGGPDVEGAVNRAGWMGAVFGIQSNGGLCHTDAGIVGGPMGAIQEAACTAFFRGLNFPPADAYSWPYQRGDNCGDCDAVGQMPMQQLDAYEMRAYCAGDGTTEWCDAMPPPPVPRLLRPPLSRAGWRIADQPATGLVRLAR